MFFGDRSIDEVADAVGAAPRQRPAAEPAREGQGSGAAPMPASDGQIQQQFYAELFPDDTAHNLPCALRFPIRLDEQRLRAAVAAVVARHPALRTTLGPVGSGTQIVHERIEPPWQVLEVARADLTEVHRFFADVSYQRFDLTRGPLVRAAAVLTPDATLLLVACHHAVVDHWSLEILIADLVAAIVVGKLPPGPGPDVTAAAWARTQQELSATEQATDRIAALVATWYSLRDEVLFPHAARGRRRNPAGNVDFEVGAAPTQKMTLESLPRTHHGKVDRRALPDPGPGSGPVPADGPAIEAKNDVEAAILAILARLLPTSTVYPTATFFDLGGHSLLATQLLAAVRDAYGVDVGLQEFFRYPTVRALASIVREHHQATAPPYARHRSPSLFTLRRNPGSATPMFALPGVLGFASAFAQISAHITARSCYALETRSLFSESDEQPALDALIEDCARTIAEASGGRAVHLVGHSFGGRLGIHLVGPLHSRGARVASLALLDPPAPAAHAREPARDRKEKLRAFLGHLVHFFPPTASQRADELFGSIEPVPEKIIFAEAQRLMDPAGAALLGNSLETEFERYLRATRVVWPEPDPIECPVLLITAADSRSELVGEPAASWARYLPASLVHREIAASHDGMLRHPHARLLALELAQFFATYDVEAAAAAPSEK